MAESVVPAIGIDSLSKTYRPRNRSPIAAVQAFTLSIPAGQVVGLLGPAGAGKTTMIKLLAGLIKPTAGRVHLLGHDLARERDTVRRLVGVVLEDRRIVAGHHTIWEALLRAGRQRGLAGHELATRAAACMHALDLWMWRDTPLRALSSR